MSEMIRTGVHAGVKLIIVPEYISCVLLTLIGVYILLDKKTSSLKESAFRITLLFSLISAINNILSLYSIEHAASIPVIINVYLNSFYYFSVASMTTMVTITTYVTLFEGRYDEPRIKKAIIVSLMIFSLEVILVLANLATGWLFFFDSSGLYHRGPLNSIGIAYLTVALCQVILFGILEWKRMKKSFRLILIVQPSCAVVLGILHYVFHDTVIMGTIIAFSLLTLFITGQQQRARVDALTELSNREAFFNDVSRLSKRKTPYHIITIGLKNFKQVNSQVGQRAGDSLLCSVGYYLKNLEPYATAYRISGVQFTLLITKMQTEAYEALFSTLRDKFTIPWRTDLCEANLCAIFADIHFPEHASSVDEVIASLEYATRLSKQDPNGKPVRFSRQLKEQFSRRNYIVAQMEKALREDLFFLNVQPVYDLIKQDFAGGEVLLRLNEDNGKPISPGEFIPIAIEIGVATKLGLMVMEKTCRFLQENKEVDLGWLSINVSSQQDEFDETVHHLEMLLKQYDIDPKHVKLEITEMVLLEDLERAHATMDELNRLGIGVYLDDFGTGYSNLVNVMTLPFECVKIDKGFIRGIAAHPKSRGMLQTLVTGLRSMNVIALAEGVETEDQDNVVRDLGIDRIQGYYYARPMATEEFVWLMHERVQIDTKQ
ncbi:MAG: hypothetical protein C0413_04600 [Clostridiales bacterium]|nr:hypothetical protein [Clostridiales bacterium]